MKRPEFIFLTVASYLLSLDLRTDPSEEVWLPKIGDDDLKRIEESDNPVVIANDWFCQGCYSYGAFSIKDGKIIKLQDLSSTKIINDGGEFIFEHGTRDHKGLIAIELQEKTPFFVMLEDIDTERYTIKRDIFFEKETDQTFVDEVLSLIGDTEGGVNIQRDQWLTLYADDYKNMLETLPVRLI